MAETKKVKDWRPDYVRENDKNLPKETSPAGKGFLSGRPPQKHRRKKVARKR